MKAIIPVAGAGTTLRPHTHTQPKPLIPVAGKPILGHIIDGLIDVEVTDFIFVVGYLGEKIKNFVVDYAEAVGFRYSFVQQEPRLGLAHAIHLCRDAIEPGEPILVHLGDTILDLDLQAFVEDPHSMLAVQKVETPWQFGVAITDDAGFIQSLVEKPNIPKSNLALVGLYKIRETAALFEATQHLMDNALKTRGEYQLTDALMWMVQERGAELKVQRVNNWHDCGKKEILLETNRILLKRMEGYEPPHFPEAIVIPPVFIADDVSITGSIVGPFVAVAENAIIQNSIVQDSILGAYSRLESIVLKQSVVGNDTSLTGRWHSINIGDNTEIDFNS